MNPDVRSAESAAISSDLRHCDELEFGDHTRGHTLEVRVKRYRGAERRGRVAARGPRERS